MKTRVILLSLVVCLVLSAAVLGQGKGFLEGDNTFGLTGVGSSDENLDDTSFGVELSLGHFFSNNLAGELRQGFNFIDQPDQPGSDDWSASTRGALDLYLGTETICPLIGANFGYVYGNAVKDTFIVGPEVGLKWFVNDTTYISALMEYQFFFDKSDNVGEVFTDGRFVYSLGLGFKF